MQNEDEGWLKYKAENPDKTYNDYLAWCAASFYILCNQKLREHADRNHAYIKSINHIETYEWLQDFMNNKYPKSAWRSELGDTLFDNLLLLNGLYNNLFLYSLLQDNLDEEGLKDSINQCFFKVARIKLFLEDFFKDKPDLSSVIDYQI